MKFLKLSIILVAVLALTAPAWAGYVPEFDAVGNDSANPFAFYNAIQYGQVDLYDNGLNENSDFRGDRLGRFGLGELFDTNAGDLFTDPCFGDFGVESALTVSWNTSYYEWIIVLQLKPSSDINLNIYDCVKEFNSENDEEQGVRWTRFAQTGRYKLPWNQIIFDADMNPEVAVKAWPGEFAEAGFNNEFVMDARTLPGLVLTPLDNAVYTSKALWAEGLVMARPETGTAGSDGQTQYTLKQGDLIQVKITSNRLPVDLYYGPDNVILKYIGFFGTYYFD